TPTPSPTASPSPQPTPAVISFTLINTDTDQPVPGFETVPNGAAIDLASLPATHFNIRANTNTPDVGSVLFGFDGNPNAHVENYPPFALFGDVSGDYIAGSLPPGQHTLTATPFTGKSATGTAGQSLAITFSVTDESGFANGSGRSRISPKAELLTGFVIAGNQPKTIVVRALGPSLSRWGIAAGLPNPTLELHDASGNLLAYDDNWRDSQEALFGRGGPFHELQPPNELEPAIAIQLPPGSYNAVIRGKYDGGGDVVAEIYDVSGAAPSMLVNVSTRACVQTSGAIVGGFVVKGSNGGSIIVRALGPSLASSGITQVMTNPFLTLYNQQGDLLGWNEHWQADPQQAAKIAQSGLAPHFPNEPAMALNLPSGTYTAVVRDENNSSGVALLDIYNVP
ncbi:MAG: hypothetical protein JO354_10400, partial [Verrucomicrobia bacterium]|nr:hypothetical protein [Verrucomicrobiota bacterium]